MPSRSLGHSFAGCVLVSFVSTLLPFASAQTTVTLTGTKELADYTFPPFANGDGRQQLSALRGQPLVVVTFSDVWGQTAGIDEALKLFEKHGRNGLQLIFAHAVSGGTFEDGAAKVEFAAWAMRRYPGCPARLCGEIRPPWSWGGLGWPPYWAVVGPDGTLSGSGDLEKGAKGLAAAVAAAMAQHDTGWGTADEAAVRVLMHRKNDLAAARAAARDALVAEVDGVWRRRVAIAEWLLADGQWSRAKAEHTALAAAASGVAEWRESLQALTSALDAAASARELELDAKLAALMKPLAAKRPTKDLPKRLRELATKNAGTAVGARAERLAKLVEQALAVK
jgi:hypothetical protein